MSEPYKGTIADLTAQRITRGHGRQAGDPVKAAQALVEVITGQDRGKELSDIFRLPLGKDAVQRAYHKIEVITNETKRCQELAEWACFEDVPYDGYPPLDM